MDISDRLEVKIIEGLDLQSINGIKPNPYVEVTCGLDFQQTKYINESTNPNWNSPAIVFNHLLAAEVDTVLVHVKHKDIFGSVDIPLGLHNNNNLKLICTQLPIYI
jgi:Ca2+-dependent lipid-binding protein